MKFEYARLSLRDNLFKISTTTEFNDPSECRARFAASGDVPALHKFIHDNYDRLKVDSIRHMNSYTPEAQAILTEDTIYKWYLETVIRPDKVCEVEKFDNLIFVMSLVKEKGLKTDADTLMWSHYADNGRGVRVTFDFPPRGLFYYTKEVNYAGNVPCFDVSSFDVWMKGESFERYIEKIVCTKGLAWAYENEARMIVPCKLPVIGQEHVLSKTVSGTIIKYVCIEYGAIRRVDFGPCVGMNEANGLISDLRQDERTSHIEYFKVDFDPEKYRYKYRRIQCEQ